MQCTHNQCPDLGPQGEEACGDAFDTATLHKLRRDVAPRASGDGDTAWAWRMVVATLVEARAYRAFFERPA